jgi:hypothetical protein
MNCRDTAVSILRRNNIQYLHPDAGLFLLVNTNKVVETFHCLLDVNIKVITGTPFGLLHYIRVNYAIPMTDLEYCFQKTSDVIIDLNKTI